MSAPDVRDAVARILRPDRPGIDAARAAVAGIDDPGAAWEALAARGVIPLAWVGDPRRRFVRGRDATRRAAEAYARRLRPGEARAAAPETTWGLALPHPPTLEAALALASDVQGVATAEALALELAGRLAPWGVPVPSGSVWRTVTVRATAWWLTCPAPLRAVRLAIDSYGGVSLPLELATGSAAWAAAVAAGAVVPSTRPGWPAGRKYADLPDPFAPLVGIWRLGYAVDVVEPDAVVLVALEA